LRRLLLLLAAAVLAYGGALRGSFHFDDYSLLSNPIITSSEGFWRMWEPVQTRPLTNLTLWLNYQSSGASPMSYHAVNLTLHLAAVLLLFLALKNLISKNAAFWGAMVFAVHPIQSEAVDYVFARGTLLSTVFCLGCLYFWLRDRVAVSIALFGCALLAKEECVTFPLFLLLIAPVRNRLRPFSLMMAMAALAGARAIWATAHTVGSGAGFTAGVTPLNYLSAQGAAIVRYLVLLVVPWGFTVEPSITASPVLRALAWAGIIGLITAAWLLRKRYLFALWFICGLVLLIPSSTIFPAADLSADRRMYLPMVAFSTAIGLITPLLWVQFPVAITIALALASVFRTEAWRTEQNLWREAVHRSPKHVRPLLQLSRTVPASEAADLLIQAKSLEPNNGGISAEIGRMWLNTGQYNFALQEFGRALALQPNNANALNNRGAALMGLKQYNAARQDFERALKLDPCVAAARKNLEALGAATSLPACPATAK